MLSFEYPSFINSTIPRRIKFHLIIVKKSTAMYLFIRCHLLSDPPFYRNSFSGLVRQMGSFAMYQHNHVSSLKPTQIHASQRNHTDENQPLRKCHGVLIASVASVAFVSVPLVLTKFCFESCHLCVFAATGILQARGILVLLAAGPLFRHSLLRCSFLLLLFVILEKYGF